MFGYTSVSPRPRNHLDLPGPDSLGDHFYHLDNGAPADSHSRFLCVCRLDDIWQLDRAVHARGTSAGKTPYILDVVHKQIGGDLANGRCFLLFDMAHEGHPFVLQSFEDLHGWCQSVGLSRKDVGLVSQNRVISERYESHYKLHDNGIRFFIYDWFINDLATRFTSDEDKFFAQFNFSKSASLEFDPVALKHPFLCMNATPRPLRVATLAFLRSSGLLSLTQWSLLTESCKKGNFKASDVQSFLRRIGREEDLFPHAIELLNGPEKKLDNFDPVRDANQLVWSIDYNSYKRTWISIITETEFTDGEVQRITEKTAKAIAMGRPTILFGNPHSLHLLRDFGFQTFHPLIDESYDSVIAAKDRFATVSNELERIGEVVRHNEGRFIEMSSEIAQFNAAHARNGGFRKAYKHNVEAPFREALLGELNRSPA